MTRGLRQGRASGRFFEWSRAGCPGRASSRGRSSTNRGWRPALRPGSRWFEGSGQQSRSSRPWRSRRRCPSPRAPEPDLARLKAHVETLASPAFGGRRDEGAARTRAYLIDEFRRLGLEPLFGGSFSQDVTGKGPLDVLGVNVGAKLPGSDPAVAEKWLILGAHYDHLGTRGEVLYPGADDNASGVAMMLEVARGARSRPPRNRGGRSPSWDSTWRNAGRMENSGSEGRNFSPDIRQSRSIRWPCS